jgi:glycosyltransferase involved in cell wall biosynthesis
VLQLIQHLQVSGAEQVVVDLACAADPARVHLQVAHYRYRGALAQDLVRAGVPVTYFEKALVSRHLPRWAAPLALPVVLVESAVLVARLARFMRREKIDVLHTHLSSAGLWGQLAGLAAGVPAMITTEHSRWLPGRPPKRGRLNRLLLPLTARVVAISEEVAASVVRHQGVPPQKVVVIANGIDLRRIDAPVAPALPAGGPPTIAAIGRLAPEKRLDVLLRAVALCRARVPQLRTLVIGEGPELPVLQRLSRELGLGSSVEFLGVRRDVPAFFPGLRAVVNSSEREGLSLALLEAMAAGVPVVATDAGGTGEVVRDGETGVLVPPLDEQALAAGIRRVLEDPALARRLAATARAVVRAEHTIAAAARRYEALYEEVCREASGVRR